MFLKEKADAEVGVSPDQGGYRNLLGHLLQMFSQIHRESIASKDSFMGVPSPTGVCPDPF